MPNGLFCLDNCGANSRVRVNYQLELSQPLKRSVLTKEVNFVCLYLHTTVLLLDSKHDSKAEDVQKLELTLFTEAKYRANYVAKVGDRLLEINTNRWKRFEKRQGDIARHRKEIIRNPPDPSTISAQLRVLNKLGRCKDVAYCQPTLAVMVSGASYEPQQKRSQGFIVYH